jgi:hypothetical protein
MGSAVSEMIAHQGPGDRSERLLSRRDLSENVGTKAVFLYHALQAANLTFDAAKASQI